MKLDLHVHSSERSGCARATDEEMIRAAIAVGLDGFFFTDHHRFIPPEKLLPLNQQFAPFRIFRGIEITCNGEDFLVLGVPDADLERTDWQYPDLHQFVRERNGFIVLAHPFRYRKIIAVDCETWRLDAVEICSANTPVAERDRIRELARIRPTAWAPISTSWMKTRLMNLPSLICCAPGVFNVIIAVKQILTQLAPPGTKAKPANIVPAG